MLRILILDYNLINLSEQLQPLLNTSDKLYRTDFQILDFFFVLEHTPITSSVGFRT